MRDFCVELADAPDGLARLGELLGDAGVNIEGLCLVTHEGRALLHFVVEDGERARRALERSTVRISGESDVFVYDKDERRVTGKPGSFGAICRALTDAGIRMTFGYPAEHNRFVFGVDDVARARVLLER